MKGYKVFRPDWTCRGFKYEVGQVYEIDEEPICCEKGFHFCEEAADCFTYYRFDPDYKVAEVEALGKIATNGTKSCTNKIKIVREIPWTEVLTLVNMGKECTGLCNIGRHNSGNFNTGVRNKGDCNSGNKNEGDCNSGNENSGICNSGNNNTGNRNSGGDNTGDYNSGYYNGGDHNSGHCNSGDWNAGDSNSGYRNTGEYNSGRWNSGSYNGGSSNTGGSNTGDCNTGNWNSGSYNTGDHNSGEHNSGNWNCGNRNSGDWNRSSFNNGCFNTIEPTIMMFNKPSEWTYRDWLDSEARQLLNQIPKKLVKWIWSEDMTEEEKTAHPGHESTYGYLKLLDESESNQIWWDGLTDDEKETIKSIPNFDADIFKKCTRIDVNQ